MQEMLKIVLGKQLAHTAGVQNSETETATGGLMGMQIHLCILCSFQYFSNWTYFLNLLNSGTAENVCAIIPHVLSTFYEIFQLMQDLRRRCVCRRIS